MSGFSRRTFAGGMLGTGIGMTLGAVPAAASRSGRRVAVLGGGVGGLTAAHELAERGFEVTVHERKALGGKARSIPVPGSGTGGRPDLPGEHGFRFVPGFYQNLPDTLGRIPLPGGGTALDNLVTGTQELVAVPGKAPIRLPNSLPIRPDPQFIRSLLRFFATSMVKVSPAEADFFAEKIVVFLTSGPRRRLGQWERMSFSDYTAAGRMSEVYRELLVDLFTETLVAANPAKANTRTMGAMGEAWLYAMAGLGSGRPPDQLLNGPTGSAWLEPWTNLLSGLGVRFELGHTVVRLDCHRGRITGAWAIDGRGRPHWINADYYVLAVPAERAARLLDRRILDSAPELAGVTRLQTDWMNGIQFFLRERRPINHGHVAYGYSPFALTSISQAQFWNHDLAGYGDGTVADVLSVDVSNWNQPGVRYGKTAKECTRQELIDEVLAQIRGSLTDGASLLPDEIVHSVAVDPAITGHGTPAVANDEPLLINTPGSWQDRPTAVTGIRNLFLAADYVRTDIDLATMEGANEAGKQAAAGVLAAAGSTVDPPVLHRLYRPPEFERYYTADDQRYDQGLPNELDLLDPYWP
ncbi:hydroxysqualene dehydroxylase [Amycolatopsis nigrescens]|uniref:hydroxysqualene dehydroxylase n=1 Tax=Amycolatopsis nigrescens TaxID=381445 RepID=UPI00039DB5EA|nr:FAD-dependent oxidoreductase [Amycolatopsis nigrescens]